MARSSTPTRAQRTVAPADPQARMHARRNPQIARRGRRPLRSACSWAWPVWRSLPSSCRQPLRSAECDSQGEDPAGTDNPASPKGESYPKTGNILGAGASVETQFTISGTEYGGFPSPLTGVVVYLPSGTKLHPQGFTTCSNAILESHEVQNCPKKSIASPKGEVLGVVSFGGTRVQEKATVQAFFTAGGSIAFFTEGTGTGGA